MNLYGTFSSYLQNFANLRLCATIASLVNRVNESSGTVMICSAQLHSLFRRGANRLQPCRESRITTMEIWRVIPSAPRYLVSSNGRVKSTFTNRILKARINEQGYRNVSLSISGRIYSRRICRLVCEAFFGPCPLGKCAAHENGVRSDDRVKNLKWK